MPSRDQFITEIYINQEQANDAIAVMTLQLTKLTDIIEKAVR